MFTNKLVTIPRSIGLALMIWMGFTVASISSASTYFVDYANGIDTADGKTTTTPWKHSPGDSAATGVPSNTVLTSGDIVNFRSGTIYLLTTSSSGIICASGVTYDGSAWGAGKAIITDNNFNPGHSAFGLYAANSNVLIQSFVVTNLGGAPVLPADTGSAISANPGVGINMSGGEQNITIANCDFAQLGFWQNVKPIGPNSIAGCGISVLGNNITITNCTFRRMHSGVQMTSGGSLTNVNLAKCSFTDSFVWCVDINVSKSGTLTDYVSVHDSNFYDYYQYNQAYWQGYTDSAGSPPHVDGIFLRCDYSQNTTYGANINFYNNKFYSTSGTGGGTAQIYVTEGPSCNIFGNVFIHSAMSDGNIYLNNGPNGSTSHQFVNIFNNTFFDNFALGVNATTDSSDRPIQSLKIINNIFYDTMTGSGANYLFSLNPGKSVSAMTNWFVDYNIYCTQNTSGGFGMYNGGTWTLAQARLWQGWENHSQLADPAFLDISRGYNNTPNQKLRLTANSPAKGKGSNLTAFQLNGLGIDINGNARATNLSAAWDIGAYVYTSLSGVLLNPPQSLFIVTGNP